MAIYNNPFSFQLIYVYRINDKQHEDCLKVGQTTAKNAGINELPNSKLLNDLAHKRIKQQTQTAGISYELLYTELTAYVDSTGSIGSFNDKKVHDILLNSGIKRKNFNIGSKATEWFVTDLQTVKRAIAAAKEERLRLSSSEVTGDVVTPIIFRPEQEAAIKMTVKKFRQKNGKRMLWNAKMRFGKTISALEVVKRMNYRRTLILTHRPVVDDGWGNDFDKVFNGCKNYSYCKKGAHDNFIALENFVKCGTMNYVYFASIQDLRGSESVGGKFSKNDDVFSTEWDLLIVDEAHEGTQTQLGKEVLNLLNKDNTRILELSGTPFNLLENVKEDEVFTWDYVMEQREKARWEENHPGEYNPYALLPTMNIYTYNLGKLIGKFIDEEMSFNFREFFRTLEDEPTKFAHEQDVKNFLNLMCNDAPDTLYPFSNQKFRNNFRHTLWMVPGVNAAKALSILLKQHPVFGYFNIANVAGNGDEEESNEDALKKVRNAITSSPESTYSITLSCGRLTTGVSVPEWTAVLMLTGQSNTSPVSYMQTIFRVQTPATIAGRMKTDCYVFDFAPDRALCTIANAVKVSAKAGKSTAVQRQRLYEFINYCPIIAMNGSVMKPLNTDTMMQQLKRIYAERAVNNGFDDTYLYTDELWKLNETTLSDFNKLKQIIGSSKASSKADNFVVINGQGFTKEVRESCDAADFDTTGNNCIRNLKEYNKKRKEEEHKRETARKTAISILRGISIRMPLLIYGANLENEEDDLTLDRFVELIDDESWNVFMPRGVTKAIFNKFKKYYDEDVFAAAVKRIRNMARAADKYAVEGRIGCITAIFNTFRNPDYETVLTPWRTVNMHIADTLGGWCFYSADFPDTPLSEPRYVMNGEVTAKTFSPNARVIEINSKSGLYPLYAAYNIYRRRIQELNQSSDFNGEITLEQQRELWNKTVEENIFVICASPMAREITRRTLLGFQEGVKANIRYVENLSDQLENNMEEFVQQVKNGSLWKYDNYNNYNNITNMEFDAVIGNPPYQKVTIKSETKNTNSNVTNIFQYFQLAADRLGRYSSLIYPGARWICQTGKGMKKFGHDQINDVRLDRVIYYENAKDVFKNVNIEGGVTVVFKDADKQTPGFTFEYRNGNTKVESRRDNPGDNMLVLNPYDEPIANQISAVVNSDSNNFDFLKKAVFSQRLFSIESNFVALNPGKVRPFSPGVPFDEKTEIKLLANDKAGTVGRACWWIANRDIITAGLDVLDKWKVIVSSASPGGNNGNNQIEAVGPNCAFGRSRVALKVFDTEREAQNFLVYCQSELVRFAFLLTGNSLTSFAKLTPDICNYKNDNGIIDFSADDINDQVYALFNITAEQQDYIKSVLIKNECGKKPKK